MQVPWSRACQPVSRQTTPTGLLSCPLSSIILACRYLEGYLEAISYGGISNTDLSLKKSWKGIFTEGPEDAAKGNHTREGPPKFSSPAYLSFQPHLCRSPSCLLFPYLFSPPPLLPSDFSCRPYSLLPNLSFPWNTEFPVEQSGLLLAAGIPQTLYMIEPRWQGESSFLERKRNGQRDEARRGRTV